MLSTLYMSRSGDEGLNPNEEEEDENSICFFEEMEKQDEGR